jgi:ribosomal protein S18 acetylase RimI-like enzyme
MNEKLIVREYKNTDITEVLVLYREAMEIIGAYKGDGKWDDDLKDIEGHYKNNGGIFLIGEVNNKIAAMGAVRKIDDETGEVKRMRTKPELQGRGFGGIILEELITEAKKLGYKELILETSEKQIAALSLYRSRGFIEFKREIIDGFNCIWFKLKIA